ncbi:hypothetical protein AB0M46_28560 [Dactylosporangium sp. NPDC051485]|uniref:hypothetical protein n=1 Tax=Dactylosporangium sp. NPDC051485 TaxID=3154846 RepID=UPI003426FC68
MNHFGASFKAVFTHGLTGDLTAVNLADFGTWGGDLLGVLGDLARDGVSDGNSYAAAAQAIANRQDNATKFSLSDWIADTTAMTIGQEARSDSTVPLSQRLAAMYASPTTAVAGYASFFARRFGSSTATASSATWSLFDFTHGDVTTTAVRIAFWAKNYYDIDILTVSENKKHAVGQAFADAVARFARGA